MNKRSIVERNHRICREWLSTHPCVDCGEIDPVVLEFHHVFGDKRRRMSLMIAGGYSEQSIRDEMRKCIVLCANCHRRRTRYELKHLREFS